MAFCMNCGAQIPDGMKFCGSCGAPVGQPVGNDNAVSGSAPVNNGNNAAGSAVPSNTGSTQMGNGMPSGTPASDNNKKEKKKSKHIFLKIVGIILLVFVLLIVSVVLLCRCSDGSDTTGTENSEVVAESSDSNDDSVDSSEADDSAVQKETAEETETTDADAAETSDTEENDYIEVMEGGVIFRVPAVFDEYEEQSTENKYINDNQLFYIGSDKFESDFSNEKFSEKKDKLYDKMEEMIDDFDSWENQDVLQKSETTVAGLPALTGYTTGMMQEHSMSFEGCYIYNENTNTVIAVYYIYNQDVVEDDDLFENVLSTARLDDGTFTESSETDDTDETDGASTDAAGVDPELKEFLDSYEAFMDEYVEFMNNYLNDPGNVVSMLNDYTEMVDELEEFEKKADEYDTENMSAADTAYYIEVTTRIEKKLLNVLN